MYDGKTVTIKGKINSKSVVYIRFVRDEVPQLIEDNGQINDDTMSLISSKCNRSKRNVQGRNVRSTRRLGVKTDPISKTKLKEYHGCKDNPKKNSESTSIQTIQSLERFSIDQLIDSQ